MDHKQGIAPYFREYLRGVLTAKEPKESDYFDWNKQQYKIDRWNWENNPLYGFCEKNKKPDGNKDEIYQDGLKIYTTLDSRMQRYAEEAVAEHMQAQQKSFFKELKRKKSAPFSSSLTKEEINGIMSRSMKQTDRYRLMKRAGISADSIQAAFMTPREMQVFTYDRGMIDTVMSPYDSIKWQKSFLRSMGMNEEPVVQVGKEGVTPTVVQAAREAIKKRELIKVRVLQNSPEEPADAIELLAERADANLVQVIGRNGLLFKRNFEKPKIVLPK